MAKLDDQYEKAFSDNLPKVDNDMVASYFVNNADYIKAEVRGAKASRSARSDYVESCVGFVQLKRIGSKCQVRARITPEHKIHNKDYVVEAIVDEAAEEIVSCVCTDCSASAGGCKHAIAFVLWLNHRSAQPSVTARECYWKGGKLGIAARKKQFVTLEDLTNSDVPKLSAQGTTFLQKVLEKKVSSVIHSLYETPGKTEKLFLHILALNYKEKSTVTDSATFLEFCEQNMSIEACLKIKNVTLDQAESGLWKKMRYARITASRAYEASRCNTDDGVLVERIFGADQPLKLPAVERGKALETDVLNEVIKVKKISFIKCGIYLNPAMPIFGSSPDGVSSDHVLEIKCPSKESTIKNYLNNNQPTRKVYAQLQFQMHFANKTKGLLCIAAPDFESTKKIQCIEVDYDKNYVADLVDRCQKFWNKFIFTKLMDNK